MSTCRATQRRLSSAEARPSHGAGLDRAGRPVEVRPTHPGPALAATRPPPVPSPTLSATANARPLVGISVLDDNATLAGDVAPVRHSLRGLWGESSTSSAKRMSFSSMACFSSGVSQSGTPCRNRRALPSEESRGHPRRALAADNVCSELSAWSCVDLPFPGCRDGPFQQPWPTAAARHRASTATHGWLFVTVERWPPLSSAIADSAPMNTERLNSPRCPGWGSPRGSCAPAHPQRRRHSNGRRSDGLRRVSRSGRRVGVEALAGSGRSDVAAGPLRPSRQIATAVAWPMSDAAQ